MKTNIEIESKVLITENDYKKIIKYFKDFKKHKIIQTNYYIDSKNFDIKKMKNSLRIRKTKEYILTMKSPFLEGLLETNIKLNAKDFFLFKNKKIFPKCKIKNQLENLNINTKELFIHTSLKTHRTEIKYENGLLCIDKNYYNNKIDYELEFEGTSKNHASSALRKICKLNHINYKENKKSKMSRAINSIK